MLRRDGLASATAQMRASSPPWLADELTRSWVGQWPALPDAMDEAARFVAPTCGQLESLAVPMGVAAATDDPVHPVEVAIEWAAAAPRAALRTVTLGRDGRRSWGTGRGVPGRAGRRLSHSDLCATRSGERSKTHTNPRVSRR